MEIYVDFHSTISESSAFELKDIVNKMLQEEINEEEERILHLLISSLGGNFYEGFSLYNFLKRKPIKINTYNMGCVDSIAILLFCAGENRYSSSFCRFAFHPIKLRFDKLSEYELQRIKEEINITESDQLNIDELIAKTIGKNVSEVEKLVNLRKSILSEEALKIGLLTEINDKKIPNGATVKTIYENEISFKKHQSYYYHNP